MKLKKWELGIIVAILLLAVGVGWAIDETVTVSMTPKALTAANYGTFNKGLACVEGMQFALPLMVLLRQHPGHLERGLK